MTRALGIEYYGDYAVVVGICSYFSLFTIASVYVTGPKIVAEVKNDKRKLDHSVSQIILFQLVTFVVVSLLFIPAFTLVPMLLKHPAVSILVFLQQNAVGLAPMWFFLGMERTKLLGISQLLIRSAGVGAILVLVRTPSDLVTYAIINLGVALTGSALLFAVLWSSIRFSYPGPRALRTSASSNAGIMLSEFGVVLYSGAGAVIVGALLGSAAAGAFAFVDRILVAARSLFVPVYNSAFPVLCRYSANEPEKVPKLRRTLLLLLLVTGCALSCTFLALAGYLVLFFGGREFANSEIYLRLLWLIPLLSVCSFFLGMLSLVVFGFVTQFSRVRILGSVLGVACLYVGTVLAGIKGAFMAVLIVETLTALGFVAVLVIEKSFLRAIGARP
ncbi:oligosaccharide flippase family protein [Bradyrhizobium sp. ISRA432]|nr:MULTISPECIES: oligosaccharide flippase family protein [unclassified Bradyrhizobium]WGR68654.1 oligosaccharide flippase family protein [Bradyrhizobium sp. ISRA426]WGR80709.1 oligosaccharide flippase family protein [Bradyrhizobium sp. ISRA430]WGR83894.1 oligosaccharide flippase family protein [Bradyrhizobium sp. ISRA432]